MGEDEFVEALRPLLTETHPVAFWRAVALATVTQRPPLPSQREKRTIIQTVLAMLDPTNHRHMKALERALDGKSVWINDEEEPNDDIFVAARAAALKARHQKEARREETERILREQELEKKQQADKRRAEIAKERERARLERNAMV